MKEVELDIEIGTDGKIYVKPNGTQGPECLDLMRFLDYIDGFEVEETVHNDDFNDKKVQIVGQQQNKRR